MRRFLVLLPLVATVMLLTASMPARADEQKKTIKVVIDGQTFRVTRAHGEIIVASKSFMTRKSPELSVRMHKAAEQATGCALKDEVWTGSTLRGNLDCP